jgi:FixH
MKWNWGTKLAVIFGIFVAAMAALVIMSMRQKIQLVATDYYKEELQYQQVIDASKLANGLGSSVLLEKRGKFIHLQLPPEMQGTVVTGELFFYCASEAGNDQKMTLTTNELGMQLISADKLQPGNYTVKIKWVHHNKHYYSEQHLSW